MLTKTAAKRAGWIAFKSFWFAMALVGAAVASMAWAEILNFGQLLATLMFIGLGVLIQTMLYDWPVRWNPAKTP